MAITNNQDGHFINLDTSWAASRPGGLLSLSLIGLLAVPARYKGLALGNSSPQHPRHSSHPLYDRITCIHDLHRRKGEKTREAVM